jgi:excisionase family DNA binding protein
MKLITVSETATRLGVSRGTVMNLVAANDFPSPVQISPRRVLFVLDEIVGWVEGRKKKNIDNETQ